MPTRRRLTIAYALLVALHLIPIWSVRYLPTMDGPSHVYNAWLVNQIVSGNAGDAIGQWHRIDWRPHPNWLGHAAMAIAMFVVPPLVAEKLLFSAIVVCFLGGAWMLAGLAGEGSRPYAFLAFPLAYNLLLQSGFYNFAAGVGLYLITIAVWWRRRDQPTLRTVAIVAALLIAVYFCHPLPAALAIGSIGLLWLFTLRRGSILRQSVHLIALIPSGILHLWFLSLDTGEDLPVPPTHELLERLTRVLFTFDLEQIQFGRAYFGLVAVLLTGSVIWELWTRRPLRPAKHDAFLALLAAIVALYFWMPAAVAGGLLVSERLTLLIPVLTIPLLSPSLPRALRIGVVIVMAAAALANVAYQTHRFRQCDRSIAAYLAHLEVVKRSSTILPLVYEKKAPHSYVSYYSHAVAYAAIDKRLVDLGNYEPGTGYFPTVWVRGVDSSGMDLIEGDPAQVDFDAFAPRAEYLSTWKLPRDEALGKRIERRYALISFTEHGRLYRRHSISSFDDETVILLPLAGTTDDLRSAGGGRWRVTQTITNAGGHRVYVAVNSCALTPTCDAHIAPGQTIPLASIDQRPPFTIVRSERSDMDALRFTTVVERTDERGGGFRAELPAVGERDFRKDSVTIPNVPISPASRLNLRLWTARTPRPAVYRVRMLLENGTTLVSPRIATRPDGFDMDARLLDTFPELRGRTLHADVVVALEDHAPGGSVWGFITSTDNATDLPSFHMPE